MRDRIKIAYFLGLVFLFSCTVNTLNLSDNQSKRQYLEEIFELDQFYRNLSSDIVSKYGYYSKHVKQNDELIRITDSTNLIKIEDYLKEYGHPKRKEVGEIAAVTPWVVIHHSGKYEIGERNFKYLYSAFINEDIDEGQFSMYLNRMYQIKYNQRIEIEGKFNSNERINKLIHVLGLERRTF